MAIERTDQPVNPDPTGRIRDSLASWGRPIALTTALVFCVSLVFPAVAAFVKDRESWPQWWGVLDVFVAFVLAALVIVLIGLTRDTVDKNAEHVSYLAYRFLNHGLLAFCVVYILSGDRIIWANCLTGFAWRTWLLLYCLPWWFTALRAAANHGGSTSK